MVASEGAGLNFSAAPRRVFPVMQLRANPPDLFPSIPVN